MSESLVEEWIKKAEEDYEAAEYLYDRSGQPPNNRKTYKMKSLIKVEVDICTQNLKS